MLDPSLFRLFAGMSRPWQRHHLDVYAKLRANGQASRDLVQAALLHDVGKGRLGLVYRALVVLLRATAPGLLVRLSQRKKADWLAGFHVDLDHPAVGALLAAEAGAAPAVVDLIARHHHPAGEDNALAALQQADDDS